MNAPDRAGAAPLPAAEPGPKAAVLRDGEIHVWHGVIEAHLARDGVAPAEAARARRMGSAHRRREFLACRGALRRILAAALGVDPLAVPIVEGAHGKPALAPGSPAAPLGFNVSHSGGRYVIALARGADPGVDVERIRPRPRLDRLARRFFSPTEQRAVAAAPDPMEAFHRVWTRKEAVIKADGRGVSLGLSRFDVGADELRPALLHARWDGAAEDEAAHWSLFALDAGAGYAAAAAVRRPGAKLVLRTEVNPDRADFAPTGSRS